MAGLSRHHDVVGIDRNPWWGDLPVTMRQGDLMESDVLQQTVRFVAPEIVIHCAALANVEACEQHPEAADTTNVTLTRRVARAAPPGCRVIYISSDGVFSGDSPWSTEDEAPAPRTVYGRSKWQGEQEVAAAVANHLIVRTNFYGWSSGRKLTSGEWLHRALAAREPMTLFTDFFFTPIYVVDVVERLTAFLHHPYRGVLHMGGRDRLSKHAFGMLMAEVGGFSTDAVRKGSLDEAPGTLRRPKDISLSSARMAQLAELEAPDSRSGLRRFLADRDRPLSARLAVSAVPA